MLWFAKETFEQLSEFIPMKAGWAFTDTGRYNIARVFPALRAFQKKYFHYRNRSFSFMSRVLVRMFLTRKTNLRSRLGSVFIAFNGAIKHRFL